jgi:hypothetical protein
LRLVGFDPGGYVVGYDCDDRCRHGNNGSDSEYGHQHHRGGRRFDRGRGDR